MQQAPTLWISVAVAVILIASLVYGYSTLETARRLAASGDSAPAQSLTVARSTQSRMDTITSAIAAADDRQAAAVDALRGGAQTKKVSGKDARNLAGTIEGVFDRGHVVLIETVFGTGEKAVTTRYYLSDDAQPILVARTYSTRNAPSEPPYSQTDRWYFGGGEYLTFRWSWDPPSAKSTDIIYPPDSERKINELRGEITAYLEALGVNTKSLPPNPYSTAIGIIDAINRRADEIDAKRTFTAGAEALATSPRYGDVTVRGFFDGPKLLKIQLMRPASSIPSQAAMFDSLGRTVQGAADETYYFADDGRLVLARTWSTYRTDSYSEKTSSAPTTSYSLQESDLYFDDDSLIARRAAGQQDIASDGVDIGREQAESLQTEIQSYEQLIRKVTPAASILR